MRALILWFLRWFYRQPGTVTLARAEAISMTDILVTWALPAETPRRAAVDHVRLEGRLVADPPLPFSPIADVPADDEQARTVTNPIPGLWEFSCVIVDVLGQEGAPLIFQADREVGFDLPGQVVSASAVVT